MRINTNVASLTAMEANTQNNVVLGKSLAKLSSGLAINKASDDASGMAIADKLRTQASGVEQGISNANSANTFIQIADKAMGEQSNILDIVKTKLMQASTSTTSSDGRAAILNDVKARLDEIFDILKKQLIVPGFNSASEINLLLAGGGSNLFNIEKCFINCLGTI